MALDEDVPLETIQMEHKGGADLSVILFMHSYVEQEPLIVEADITVYRQIVSGVEPDRREKVEVDGRKGYTIMGNITLFPLRDGDPSLTSIYKEDGTLLAQVKGRLQEDDSEIWEI